MAMLESDASRIRNSSKVVGITFSNDSELFSIRMAQAVETEAIGNVTASPPLTLYTEAVEACFRYIEADFPLHLVSGGMMVGRKTCYLLCNDI